MRNFDIQFVPRDAIQGEVCRDSVMNILDMSLVTIVESSDPIKDINYLQIASNVGSREAIKFKKDIEVFTAATLALFNRLLAIQGDLNFEAPTRVVVGSDGKLSIEEGEDITELVHKHRWE